MAIISHETISRFGSVAVVTYFIANQIQEAITGTLLCVLDCTNFRGTMDDSIGKSVLINDF